MVAESGWSPRRVHCESTASMLSRALVAQQVAGRWSLRFWHCESALSADLDPPHFWIPYDVTHFLGMRSSLKNVGK